MKATVDVALCVGHGLCYLSAPQVFTDDEQGYAEVRDGGAVSPSDEEVARRAAANCPEKAIIVL